MIIFQLVKSVIDIDVFFYTKKKIAPLHEFTLFVVKFYIIRHNAHACENSDGKYE